MQEAKYRYFKLQVKNRIPIFVTVNGEENRSVNVTNAVMGQCK